MWPKPVWVPEEMLLLRGLCLEERRQWDRVVAQRLLFQTTQRLTWRLVWLATCGPRFPWSPSSRSKRPLDLSRISSCSWRFRFLHTDPHRSTALCYKEGFSWHVSMLQGPGSLRAVHPFGPESAQTPARRKAARTAGGHVSASGT